MKAILEKAAGGIKKFLVGFDIFSLGNSATIRLLLMFLLAPLVALLKIPSRYTAWFSFNKISLLSTSALLYVLIGVAFFVFGYSLFFIFRKRRGSQVGRFLGFEWNQGRVLWMFVGAFFIGLSVKVIRILFGGFYHINISPAFSASYFYSLLGLVEALGGVALAIALINYYFLKGNSDTKSRTWKFLSAMSFFVEFSFGFFSGSKLAAITPIIIYLIVRHYAHKRSFWRVFLAAVVIVTAIFPLMNFMRSPDNLLQGYLGGRGLKTVSDFLSVSQFVTDGSINRLDQSRVVSVVFDRTESFSKGRGLLGFFISLGPPRFIWHSKPGISTGDNRWGREMGLLDKNDFETSVAPTVIGDWYLNFGIPGIIFGMFLIGLLFGWIYNSLIIRSGANFSALMIYSVIWIQIIHGLEGWIAPFYAGQVKLLVILFVIHLFLTARIDFPRFAFWRRDVPQ